MPRTAPPTKLSAEDRLTLEKLLLTRGSSQALCKRVRVVLLAAEGLSDRVIATEVGLHYNKVAKWRERFAQAGLEGLKDKKRQRSKRIDPAKERVALVEATRPPEGRARWTQRTMAAHAGLSHSAVQRLWAKNDIKPHRTRTFKLSTDPEFEAKFWDIVGLYLCPPIQAVLLCCDEKSQIQALNRTQPGLPLGLGHIRTETHDYYRHGTITLFAALNYLSGKIISRLAKRHTTEDWIAFLEAIDQDIAPELEIHIVCDNYRTHKTDLTRVWLAAHPRFKMHFTPTGSSWMNMVERFFRDITHQAIVPGSFASVKHLCQTIETYLAQHNLKPRTYQWRADGAEVLAKIKRAWEAALDPAKEPSLSPL
jgi:transposase